MNSKITLRFFSTLLCLVAASNLYAQILQTSDTEQHSIKNASLLYPFFEKLVQLEKNKQGKINIVHIGDSHIQSDFFTNAIRNPLQQKFGDGGRGFIFPYSFNKPTGRPYHFASNANWQICRNNMPLKCYADTEIGLSGYGLSTRTDRFVLSVEASEDRYKFNTIKVVAPITSFYRLAMVEGNKKPLIHSERFNITFHRVKKGETLDIIARAYKVSTTDIKRANKMKSNNVNAGRNLRIPITITETGVDTSMFRPLEYQLQERFVSVYHQDKPVSVLYLLQSKKQPLYSLNGLIIENDSPGLIYHNIGTTGSMATHYNANPLFFEQLPILSPDLVIVSFGTNESFSNISAEKFIAEIEMLINNIRITCHNVPILIITPPISLLHQKRWNTYILEYSEALLRKDNVAIWDLYSFTKGLMGSEEKFSAVKISHDYIHYTSEGYLNQGTEFVFDFLNEYKYYKRSHE
ncbi:MAG: LysM peptidoglycan-binding domain-containing protein [Fibromonadaceae bacterium]|jgi:LysM repeat protein|nr:LysM peptidoglycan-binding domain-containing protein [Fibromonadaceae bacterium]